jgi:hypothetical protein
LLAALPIVYPDIPVQRCWAHKIRNVLDKARAADRHAVKNGLHAIMNAATLPRPAPPPAASDRVGANQGEQLARIAAMRRSSRGAGR